MKRCPQCDFIYEDEQRLCDIDGTALVHDSRPLPQNASPQQASSPAKSRSKVFAIVAIAGFVLGLLLFFLFYVFRPRTAQQNTNFSSAKVTTDPQSAPNLVLPAPAARATPHSGRAPITNVNAVESPSRIVKDPPGHSLSPVPKREERKPNPKNAIAMEESRVGSILQKARRILKKPLEF